MGPENIKLVGLCSWESLRTKSVFLQQAMFDHRWLLVDEKNLNADHLSSHIENTRKTPVTKPHHISTFRSLPSPISVRTSLQPKRRQLCFCSWKWSMFQWESLYLRNGVALRWPLDFGETNIHTSGILGFPAEPTIRVAKENAVFDG